MAPHPIASPGHLTVSDLPAEKLASLKRHGYEWVAVQAQNATSFRDYDMGAIAAAGLAADVWGVTYGRDHRPDADVFFRDGKLLGQQAVKLRARRVHVDVEFAAKGTRADRGLRPIVNGLRAGGWLGPVDLNTLGAPANPDVNDYAIDVASFLETGGGVFCQSYFNAAEEYRPSSCVRYWTRVGVPRERLNLQIGLHRSESNQPKPGVRLAGAEWRPLLEEAGLGRAFSIFLAEYAEESDLVGLDPLSLPPVVISTSETRSAIAAAAALWERQYSVQRRARITIARRIASTANSDAKWRTIAEDVASLLDDAGVGP